MGRYITTTGTSGVTNKEVSTNVNAEPNDRLLVNTSSAAITVTLPANASLLVGDTIQIIDVAGNASSNNITVGRNGSEIQNATEDLTIDINNAIVTLIYSGSTYGWVVGSV